MINVFSINYLNERKMKELKRLKLTSLSKSNLKDREMSRICGGNYCATYGDNQRYNEDQDLCSCNCTDPESGKDYYTYRRDDASIFRTL